MSKKILLSIALTTALCISCKKELVPQESFVDYSKTSNSTNPNPGNLVTGNMATTNTSLQNGTTINKVNPPHGQPGHVCGPTTTNTTPNNIASNNPVTITDANTILPKNATKTLTVGKGMNPAHGQPGHRCDIAVGAPLNSKPKTVTTPVNTTTSGANTTPALLTSNATAPGTNPPHGQPGHVCGPTPTSTTTTTPTPENSTETKKE